MEINLSKNSSCQMEVAAKAAYPGECCGILLGKTGENGEIEVLEIDFNNISFIKKIIFL